MPFNGTYIEYVIAVVNNSSVGDTQSLPSIDTGRLIWKVGSPLIIIFGTFGNIMVFLVLNDRNVTHPSMAVYLRVLAVSDLIAILDNIMFRWIRFQFGFDVWVVHEAICKLSTWTYYSCSTMSTWTLVVMVTQRAVAVVWPHKVSSSSCKYSLSCTIALLLVFSMTINSHFLYFSTIINMKFENVTVTRSCNENYDDEVTTTVFKVWFWINTLTSSCLPFAILLIDDVILIRRVVTATREARDRLAVGSTQQVKVREKKAVSMTVTLIVTSLTFFFLTFPYCAFTVTQMLLIDSVFADKSLFEMVTLIWSVCTLVWCCNNAVNFYLYCWTGTRFRTRAKQLLCCYKMERTVGSCETVAATGKHFKKTASGDAFEDF
ncbi:C-C chemokine receptor type 1-like [Pomacea canaliculata]|uniref:C-C chemokine receptor type 1-like n=1 Tax=Pomacea canaliculata TaxID=400727 RepID=UPI000D737317|nr:C-C chemokine receptor type 1-like [Pomacea canaliculata]